MYDRAGFTEVARRKPARPGVRKALRGGTNCATPTPSAPAPARTNKEARRSPTKRRGG
jgi:hypothetical protein